LRQCLNNGVSNALKFTPRGGSIYFRAWLGANSDEHAQDGLRTVVIEVEDTGTGLAEEDLAELNAGESFTQVGLGAMQGNGGTGLGLSITKSILRLHNKSKLFMSSPGEGKGVVFTMHLFLEPTDKPLGNQALADVQDRARQNHIIRRQQLTSTGPSAMPMRALLTRGNEHGSDSRDAAESNVLPPSSSAEAATSAIWEAGVGPPGSDQPRRGEPRTLSGPSEEFCCLYVEDDSYLQMTTAMSIFKPLGIAWDSASNGQEAIRMFKERSEAGKAPYAIILMDNQMPRMNGATATRLLRRELGYEGTIIGMTGDPQGSPDRAEFEASGLNGCVDKDTAGVDFIISTIKSLYVTNTEASSCSERTHSPSGSTSGNEG